MIKHDRLWNFPPLLFFFFSPFCNNPQVTDVAGWVDESVTTGVRAVVGRRL